MPAAEQALQKIEWLYNKYHITKTTLALSFVLSFKEISTVIPGIKTPEQAIENTQGNILLTPEEKDMIIKLYASDFEPLLGLLQQQG
jgi:aryl-alcohol dehydrogenase-like predicted oxidoreductase